MPLSRVVYGALASTVSAFAVIPAPVVRGIDHMPVAVADLDGAKRDFERLGFVMKPGRPHSDGIRNVHAKFPNHGGIELITAADPTSDLARGYVRWLAEGEGAAWLALYAPGDAPASAPHSRLFYGSRDASPTDGPQWFAHPNTADRLQRAWLAGAPADYARLLTLGAARARAPRCSPFPGSARALQLADGEQLIFLPADGRPADRAVRGATVHVRDLAATRRLLARNGVGTFVPKGCAEPTIWVKVRGLWLQFLG